MCGIAGYIGPRLIEEGAVTRCHEAMRHRGPDGRGTFRDNTPDGRHVVLLHARLSIVDLDPRAGQPMSRGGYTMVFNGELYNYLELGARLRDAGLEFTTKGDTEVLLTVLSPKGREALGHGNLPEQQGMAAVLDRCEGMWAYALYNASTGDLMLCRDRFGEKPLYVMRDADGGVYFGSEPKLLAALSGRRLPVNRQHMARYLVNGYKALYKTPQTFFEGVHEVHSGTMLTIRQNDCQKHTYWARPVSDYDPVQHDMTFGEAVQGVRDRLIRSVELRLRSDVPLAFCMSGGIDSNSLICIARKVFDYNVHGFTVMNTDTRYEERAYVEHVVRELGLRHTAVAPSCHGFLEGLRTLVQAHDAPVFTISYYVHWLLMQQIREHGYAISISGTAADELFSGYYDHHNLYLAALHGRGAVYDEALTNWRQDVATIVRNPYLQDPDVFVKTPDERGHIFLHNDRFASYLSMPFTEPFAEEAYHAVPLRNRMLNELFHEAVPVILHEDDLNAMYHSVENRSPFLDRALFDFTQRIPTRHLVKDGMAKAVLREAMRGIVPDMVLDNRRKVGFNAPVLDFLDVHDKTVRSQVLADSPIWDVVRRDAVEAMLDGRTLGNSESKFVFNVLCCKMFLEDAGTV
ncbi:asparagine synthase (glutamine-hydrolyzing) [Oleidesulfovibrio sp.]|uniref:asparagine synthase (glutamine-hydrolyzing) n=1 Tax=Oleidesulfovibrio sp. TaxID=2909707 RepID=UPI003A852F6B